jgi:acetyltransferase-like isoleucine patch superfamily enzyme
MSAKTTLQVEAVIDRSTTDIWSRIQRLKERLRSISTLFREISVLKTLYWNYRCNLPPFSILLYPEMDLRMGENARIVHKAGRLHLGCRWSIGRFRPSELIIAHGATLEINGDFRMYTGCTVIVDSGASLSLGSGGTNLGVRLSVFNSLTLGNDVFISENVTIRDSDNHLVTGGSGVVSAPITIEDHVLIGVNSTILKGVTIGRGAVVAAGSVVNRSVPPGTLVGGTPARTIRQNVNWKL